MKHHLLLVEDNPDDHYMVKRALRCMPNLEIAVAVNGREAVDYLFAHEQSPPALVLLDVKMPQMSGIEALCLIRTNEALAELPVVVFSSSNEPTDIEEAMRCKATEFVQKPVNFDNYNETVLRLVQQYIAA